MLAWLAQQDLVPIADRRPREREGRDSRDHALAFGPSFYSRGVLRAYPRLSAFGQVDLEFGDLLAQGIAVDAEQRGGADLVALSSFQHALE